MDNILKILCFESDADPQVFSEMRHLVNMNQREFAAAIGIDQAQISRYENGRCLPKLDVFLRMLRLTGGIIVIPADPAGPEGTN